MKKWICGILAVLMLLPVFATTAFASGHGHGHSNSHHNQMVVQKCVSNKLCENNGICSNSCAYADENGDYICDNCENQCADCGETKDENSDGICDSCGKCSHYRDDNNDGVCDHQAECAERNTAVCTNTGKRHAHRGGKHRNHH